MDYAASHAPSPNFATRPRLNYSAKWRPNLKQGSPRQSWLSMRLVWHLSCRLGSATANRAFVVPDGFLKEISMKNALIPGLASPLLLAAALGFGLAQPSFAGVSVGYYGHHGHGGHGSHAYRYGHRGYGRYGYSHSYRAYPYYGYGYSRPYYRSRAYDYSYREPVVVRSVPSHDYSDSASVASSAPAFADQAAWDRLAEGQHASALSQFADAAQRHPDTGLPKLGYALASAANGDHERAVWAMRRALATDADALHYAPLNERNRALVDTLAARYTDGTVADVGASDAAFMAAALHYIRHDNAAAARQIELAMENGDQSDSASRLEEMIQGKNH
jgi:hypothetical protein